MPSIAFAMAHWLYSPYTILRPSGTFPGWILTELINVHALLNCLPFDWIPNLGSLVHGTPALSILIKFIPLLKHWFWTKSLIPSQ